MHCKIFNTCFLLVRHALASTGLIVFKEAGSAGGDRGAVSRGQRVLEIAPCPPHPTANDGRTIIQISEPDFWTLCDVFWLLLPILIDCVLMLIILC